MVPTGLGSFAAHGLSSPKIPVCYDGKWDATFAHFTVWDEGLEKQVLLRIYDFIDLFYSTPKILCCYVIFVGHSDCKFVSMK